MTDLIQQMASDLQKQMENLEPNVGVREIGVMDTTFNLAKHSIRSTVTG